MHHSFIHSYWGASGLSSWTTSLLCLHGITRFCHSETWLFTSLLWWWHSTLPLIPSWWSANSCSHLSLSNRHLLLDEGPSPSTQPCRDRTACGSIKPIGTSQFHLPVRHINHNSTITSTISGPFFQNMFQNSLFKLLFCPGWTIAMLSWQVFQPVLLNLYN